MKKQSKQATEWAAKIAKIYSAEYPNEKLCENWSELAYSECDGNVYFFDWESCHNAIAAELLTPGLGTPKTARTKKGKEKSMNAKQTLVSLPGELHAWLMASKAHNVSLQAHIISLLDGLRKKGGRP